MRTTGRIVSWNDDRGFGFIAPEGGGKTVFVHIRAFSRRRKRPDIGEVVTYVMSRDKQGRPCAARAASASERLPVATREIRGILLTLLAVLFLLTLSALSRTGKLPFFCFGIYAGTSLVAFCMYASDKRAAKKGTWRTPEASLHTISLAGGWPGAIVAQEVLRHKSKKQPFRAAFWVTVVVNCAAALLLFTPQGLEVLGNLFSHLPDTR